MALTAPIYFPLFVRPLGLHAIDLLEKIDTLLS